MYRLQFAFPLFLVFGSPTLFADQVTFKNGDRLTGLFLKSDSKCLVMKTAIAGEVTVSWPEIKELRSDLEMHVGLADGRILVGKIMTGPDGQVEISTSTGATVDARMESVVTLRSAAEQLAHKKSSERGMLRSWDGGLDVGFELTRGNSDTRNLRFAFRAVRRVPPNNLTIYVDTIYSTDDLPSALPHVTANESRGGARFDRDFTSRFFLFANVDFMSDALQDLNLRSVLGGGVGYHLIKRGGTSLNVLGGANFTREHYVETQRNLGAGQVGQELKINFGKNTSLIQNVAFFPDLTGTGGNYRIHFSVGTITKIVEWLGWQNNFSDIYVSNPPAGKKQNELVFTSGLHVAFSH